MSVRVPYQSYRLLVVCCYAVASYASGVATSNSTAMPVQKVLEILQDMKLKSTDLKGEADSHIEDVRKSCTDTKTESNTYIDAAARQIESLSADIEVLRPQINTLIAEIADHQSKIVDNEFRLKNLLTEREQEHLKYQRDIEEYDVTIAAIKRAQEILKVQETVGGASAASSSFLQIKRSRNGKPISKKEAVLQALQVAMATEPETEFSKDASQIFSPFDTLTTATKEYEANTGSVKDILQGLLTTIQGQKTAIMNTETTNKGTFDGAESALRQELTTDKEALVTKKGTRAEKELLLLQKEQFVKSDTESKAAVEAYLAKVTTKCDKKESDYTEMNTLRIQEIAALEKAIAFITSLGISGGTFLQLDAKVPHHPAHLAFPALGMDSSGNPTKKMAGFIRVRAAQLSSSSLRKLAKRVAALAAGKAKDDDPLAEVKQMIADLIVKLKQDSVQDAQKNEWCTQQLSTNEADRTSATASIEKTNARIKKTASDLEVVQQEIQGINGSLDVSKEQRTKLEIDRTNEKQENEEAIEDAETSKVAVQAAMTLLEEYYQNVSKAYGAFYQRSANRGLHATLRNATYAPNMTELPADLLKEAPASVSLEAGNSVVAMLEVIRDRYSGIESRLRTQETEAQELYIETKGELDAQIAALEKDYTNKKVLEADYTAAGDKHSQDLGTYTQALSDANTNHENLKGPCLAGDDSEQRRLQLQGEINALKEAETMIQDFLTSGGFLQTLSRLVSHSGARDVNTIDDIAEVVILLEDIKTEVLADIQSDQTTYNQMKDWCTKNMGIVSASITQHNSRDTELVNMIEVSAQNKAQLEIELKSVQAEQTQAQQALANHATLRNKDLEAFRLNEKELLQSIQSLDNALVVLTGHYDKVKKADERNFTAEQAELTAAKGNLNLTLVHVAGQVSKALKSMPASEMNAAMTSPDTSAILQAFFANPLELLGHKRATLTQTSALVTGGVDGETVLGILKQLLETFKADLAAAQASEANDAGAFDGQQNAKQLEIDTLIQSVGIKQEQLAHYISVNAQAKEDLTYLREIRSSDVAYLTQLQSQCALNDAEYQSRSSIRQNELNTINEAIAMLQAGDSGGQTGGFLLHSRVQQVQHHSGDHQHVFVHHRQPVNRILLKVSKGHAASSISKGKNHVTQPAEGVPLATAMMHGNASSAVKHKGNLLQRSFMSSSTSLLQIPSGIGQAALRNLKKHTMALNQRSSGVDDEAFKVVITQLEIVHRDLKEKKQLEVTMRDTCIKEKESTTREKEQREAEQGLLNTEKEQLDKKVSDTTETITGIDTQIDDKNQSLVAALAARNAEHAKFNTSIAKELARQTKLQQAVHVLRDFYATKGITAEIQRATHSAPSSQTKAQVNAAPKEQKRPTVIRALPNVPVQLVSASTARSGHKSGKEEPVDALENVTKYDRLNKSSVKAAEQLAIPNATKFEKPVQPHSGSKGIIGILGLLIDQSEEIVQQIVKDEEYGVDAYRLDVQETNRAIEELKSQKISQNQVLADTNDDLLNNQDARTAVAAEIAAIIAYISAVNTKCNTLLTNFESNQETRQKEIDDMWEARNALLTQISSDT
mmetsp:Transcript_124456/g.229328  ORF Transcript_124456/g.229328 Transcript_124456/m.229328 type:complete len:1580 (-) Transcript_124456:32-4771(-)